MSGAYRGWLTNDAAKIAHYFRDNGHSACHQWVATTRDRPAHASIVRCRWCEENEGIRRRSR